MSHLSSSAPSRDFKAGDEVTITIQDVDVLQHMQVNHGEWIATMNECINQPCQVILISEFDFLIEAPSGRVYSVNKDIISKYKPTTKTNVSFTIGDKVKVITDENRIKELQKNHGGWNDYMKRILGAEGVVESIHDKGDVSVKINNDVLRFNEDSVERVVVEDEPEQDVTTLVKLFKSLGGLFQQHDSTQEGTKAALSNVLGEEYLQLIAAVKIGDIEQTNVLLDLFGPDISLLYLAIHEGHEKIVQLFLDNGADPMVKSVDGNTALHFAVQMDRFDICRLLAKEGSSVNEPNNSQTTALMIAASEGFIDILRYLVKVPDVDLNIGDKDKDTALHLAIHSSQMDSVKVLLEAGADMMIVNEKQFSSYHLAALSGNEKILEIFLKKAGPCIVDFQKEDKFAALHIAALNNHPGCMKLLIKYNADINIRNGKLRTPLHIAVSQRYFECVKILVENKAEINLKDESGDTPIHDGVSAYTVEYLQKIGLNEEPQKNDNSEDIILYLAKNGVDLEIKNNAGMTVLDTCIDEMLKTKLINLKKQGSTAKIKIEEKQHAPYQKSQAEIEELKKKIKRLEEEKLCVICRDKALECTFECGHLSCESCAANLFVCHICRAKITKIIKIYN